MGEKNEEKTTLENIKANPIVAKVKDVVKDRYISAQKDNIMRAPLRNVTTALGVAYGIKKGGGLKLLKEIKRPESQKAIRSAILNYGVPAYIGSGIATDALIPAIRLKRMEKKIDTESEKKVTPTDYAKLTAVKTVPSIAYYALLNRSKGKMADGLLNVVNNGSEFIKHKNFHNLRQVGKSAKNIVLTKGLLDAIGDAGDLAQMSVTPETIIKSKKKEVGKNMNKEAYEIVEDAYEKIAALNPGGVGKALQNFGGRVLGTNVKAAKKGLDVAKENLMNTTQINRAARKMGTSNPALQKRRFNVANEAFTDAKNNIRTEIGKTKKARLQLAAGVAGAGVGVTALNKAGKKEKTAYEIVEEAYEKMASMTEE